MKALKQITALSWEEQGLELNSGATSERENIEQLSEGSEPLDSCFSKQKNSIWTH